MLNRALLVAVAASAVLLAGCSSTPTVVHITPSASPSSSPTSTEKTSEPTASASGPLGPDECVEVTGAQLDLILATDSEGATTAADTLKKYDPPASVTEAIDHFVESGGIQFDDPDANAHTDELKKWVSEVCPS